MIRVYDTEGMKPQSHRLPVIIIADSEEEILALGEVVQDSVFDDIRVIPEPGSTAVTAAGGAAVVYLLLPGGWVKAGG